MLPAPLTVHACLACTAPGRLRRRPRLPAPRCAASAKAFKEASEAMPGWTGDWKTAGAAGRHGARRLVARVRRPGARRPDGAGADLEPEHQGRRGAVPAGRRRAAGRARGLLPGRSVRQRRALVAARRHAAGGRYHAAAERHAVRQLGDRRLGPHPPSGGERPGRRAGQPGRSGRHAALHPGHAGAELLPAAPLPIHSAPCSTAPWPATRSRCCWCATSTRPARRSVSDVLQSETQLKSAQ